MINDYGSDIHFPRFEKKQQTTNHPAEKVSKIEIIEQIERARVDLTRDLTSLGVDCSNLNYHCQIKPTQFARDFNHDQISDDDDDSSDDDGEDDEDVEEINDDDRKILTSITRELQLEDH